jgi:NitT/TauT family transport system substrate-binding protein
LEDNAHLKLLLLIITSFALLASAAGCGSDDDNGDSADAPTSAATASGTAGAEPTESTEPVTLRLGYFPNITHAQPQVGLLRGTFAEILGSHVTIETTTFNAGPAVIEALFAGEIDASYIGPNPAINGYVQSDGKELRIIAGATSGGALLVVRPEAGIATPADFADKKVATPQLGNTQDVALRAWLADNGLNAREQGGNVQVLPTANADTLTLFQQGDVDAAWVPEPWATRLVQEAGGEIFLDEKTLWPEGKFVTTHIIVRTEFLEDHPDVVEDLVRAHVETTQWINENPAEAKQLVNQSIEEITTKALPQAIIDAAWENMDITYDPVASSLFTSAEDAFELEFLSEEPDLDGIYALDLLNKVLREKGLPEVKAE